MKTRGDTSECDSCRAEIIWARSAKSGRWLGFDVAPAPPGTPGALALMGTVAYGRAGLLDRLAEIGDLNLAPADYPVHMPHFRTCPLSNDRRPARPHPRRRRR